eukprot:TRINITY_DN1425_c2_g5_i1.p1 TRINITY_DN1425_c2_g5~~TRINITY_DN1425_c2_g5_i1.p1  ORF type:complete len:115 (+),score=33.74 TRINITY_DN1425_c2_g5_i1:45-347(+)
MDEPLKHLSLSMYKSLGTLQQDSTPCPDTISHHAKEVFSAMTACLEAIDNLPTEQKHTPGTDEYAEEVTRLQEEHEEAVKSLGEEAERCTALRDSLLAEA